MSKLLICGVNGFVGKHLALELSHAGHEVHGIELKGPLAPQLTDVVSTFLACDLTDQASVAQLDLRPYAAVINLAGLANVGASFDNPDLYMRVNVDVLRLIGEEALRQKASLRLIAVSTGAVYKTGQPLPLSEASEVDSSSSPYAKSKLAMEKVADSLRTSGLDCVVVRPFNHIGPGQGPGFILPDLYSGLTKALKSKQPLMVGNLQTKRDYTDVRDVVKAYTLLATAPANALHHSLYNVCSGQPRSGEEILTELQKNVAGSEHVVVEVDQARIRPTDPMELRGSNERLATDTDWKPSIAFTQTIADFVQAQS